jgi:hypothetical protein
MIDLRYLENEMGEYVYFICEQDCFWISPFNVGDFVQEYFGFNYIYVGEL